MGLRTASVRHPHVEVMAPALTETTKIHFKLASKEHLENACSVEIYESNKYHKHKESYCQINDSKDIPTVAKVNNESICEKQTNSGFKELVLQPGINHNIVNNIMNSIPSSVCDQENKMGLQKTMLNLPSLNRQKKGRNVEKIFSNFESAMESDDVCAGDTVEQDDNICVFKSMEVGEKLHTSGNELSNDNEMFSITGTDLTNHLSPFEKDLLENVDVMNMELEDQHEDIDTMSIQKESQAEDLFNEMAKKHAKIERKLAFLRRRAHKLQSRLLGQHISYEISGIYENVYKLIKKPKDLYDLNSSSLVACEGIPEKMKPLSSNSARYLIRKLEMTSALQANSSSHQKVFSKYFGSGSVEVPAIRSHLSGIVNILPWPMDQKNELYRIACQLKTQLSLSQQEVDSEATESSSGGESCDEMHSYNNPHQQYLSV